ncbi:NifB/NifX family molybdenum-iron cluster-binding protein [Colibacter massiliensis]|uniref:NifB/NifX family molybdenum-iron cluster-binding protein n=1 Tax=Colibacter massiliensis TaxID=1852379 RepID=UPI003F8FB58D
MKIAVPYEDGKVFQHFGKTKKVKVYTVEDGTVTAAHIAENTGEGHEAVTDFLKALDIDVVICGNIGGCAQKAVREAGMELYGGVYARCDDAVNAFLTNNLAYDPDAGCPGPADDSPHVCR